MLTLVQGPHAIALLQSVITHEAQNHDTITSNHGICLHAKNNGVGRVQIMPYIHNPPEFSSCTVTETNLSK